MKSPTLSAVRLRFVAAFALVLLAVPVLSAQKAHSNPYLGDTPETAPPQATDLSPKFERKAVAHAMQKVGDWQLQKAEVGFDQDWTFAALYAGYMSVPDAADGKKYREAMARMSKKFNYEPGPRMLHADDHAIGQTYLDLYLANHDSAVLGPIKKRMEEVMAAPDDPNKPLWWWCDALFMAPPVLTRLTLATGDKKYIDYMDHEWHVTSDLLWNEEHHLYFRDKTFLNAKEKNGQPIFWSRGNGWVIAGLARVLAQMPKDYPSRPFYVKQLQQMAAAIAAQQQSDGLWRPGLLNETGYPYAETSGSAFFLYGIAWGVNNGLLDRKTYLPVLQKGWAGLLTHVYADGRLGAVQPIGAAPGDFQPQTSNVYGIGAYLLAGSEIYKMSK